MSTSKTCPQCSKPMPEGAPEGLCPECLVKVGIGSEFGVAGTPTVKGPPPALSIDNIARHFPQLEIIEQLGQGGMGVVYKARQKQLDRVVALKVLPPAISADPSFVERFQREARALAKLNHPSIVAVFDFGQTRSNSGKDAAAPLCFFIMEFVDGMNLRQLQKAKKLTPQEALGIVPKICEALQFAHDEGIVHRDIKPENILVDTKGRVKIADFGLAKLMGRAPTDLTLTGVGQVMGTPHYMAPEQIQGTHDVDHRADIYSLGVVFYEMLTGELPLGRFSPPSKKVQMDVRLDEVVLKALEQEPSLRFQKASDVKTQVENISGIIANLPAHMRHAFGFEFKSEATLFGLPLVHIAQGTDPVTGKCRRAKGIIAIGDVAKGVVAMGGAAYGFFAFGGFAVGVISVGGAGIGLFSFSGLAVALLLACGGIAIGPVTFGGLALGYIAAGGIPFGVHVAGGGVNDPLAMAVFERWQVHRMFLPGMLLMFGSTAACFLAYWWAKRQVATESSQAQASRSWPVLLAAFVVAAGIGLLVLAPVLGRKSEKPIFYTFAGFTHFVKGAAGPELQPSFAKELGLSALQSDAVNQIIPKYYAEFVALERQHTTVTNDARGRVHITIAPFGDETVSLARRLNAEIRGTIGREILNPDELGNLITFGLFRHCGAAPITTELWKEGEMYYFEEKHGRRNFPGGGYSEGQSRNSSGRDWKQAFPGEYWIYWKE